LKCLKTEFTKIILCSGSMIHWLEIVRRQNTGTQPGQLEIQSGLVAVEALSGRLESIGGTTRYQGVNEDDAVTHFGYCGFDQTIYELDRNNLFVKISGYSEGEKNRLFKLKKIEDYGEQRQWLRFHLTETGFDNNEAAYV